MFPTFKQRLDAIATRLRLIKPLIFDKRLVLKPFEYRPEGSDDWTTIPPNTYWGTWVTNFEMRGGFAIPDDWTLTDKIALHLPIGDARDFEHPEALVYIDGAPLAAVDRNHQILTLPEAFKGRGDRALTLRGWTGNGGTLDGDWRQRLNMGEIALVTLDEHMEEFIVLARTALEAVQNLDDLRPEKYDLLEALEAAFGALNTVHPLNVTRASAAGALAVLKAALAQSGAPHPLVLHSAGHAHIDTAWLWRTAQTRRKVERTFHSVLNLMEEFPEYIFVASQPQLYEWFRQMHPESFARIQERVREGRWEPLGGMWIESDCNITGAESLVRQFMLGRAFFREHFGADADTPIFFLPDAFGFPASLPQIAAGAGMKYFFTIKVRWSEVNEFPYDSFWWEGIDGTRLLTHMSTVPWAGRMDESATYNADPKPGAALAAWAKLKEKRQRDELMAYGWGDGGGGPTRDHIQSIRAMTAFPGLPQHQPSRAREFYELLERKYGESLHTWRGELYLETHQGTLTSQTRIKRAMHDAEALMHDAEFLAAYASLLDSGYAYPHDDFDWAWHVICLNQFHDILPGSSIDGVYVDAVAELGEVMERIGEVKDAALDAIAAQFDADSIVVNTLPVTRRSLVTLPTSGTSAAVFSDASSVPLLDQATESGHLYQVEVGAFQAVPVRFGTAEPRAVKPLTAEPTLLENAYLRVEFDDLGSITRLRDKVTNSELIPSGALANQFIAYEDRPAHFDAWNIDPLVGALSRPIAYAEALEPPRVVEAGALRATIEFKLKILDSTITQRVSIGSVIDGTVAGSASDYQVTFDVEIDWHERFALLKSAFPFALHANEAAYGVQWGQVKRPMHRNTTWDAAKWEVAHHRWINLREEYRGVTLIDNGIYASSVQDDAILLTLVKRASSVDPVGDSGMRRMRYGIVTRMMGDPALTEAYAISHPFIAARAARSTSAALSTAPSMVQTQGAWVETIKRSEDDQAFVFRLYEPRGMTHAEKLTFGFPVASVQRTNLLEEPGEELSLTGGNTVEFTLKPFEIVTLRVVPQQT